MLALAKLPILSEASHTEQLAGVLLRGHPGSLFMCSLHVDDSGTHDGSRGVVLAGFVSTPEQWSHFDRDWRSLLQEFQIPRYFHMADFESRFGVYEGWSNERRKEFIKKLTGIIRRRSIAGIAASCPAHNYEKLKAGLPKVAFQTPFTMCMGVCWRLLGEWADNRDHAEVVATICETGTEGEGEILTMHGQFINDEKIQRQYRLGPLAFDTKEGALPLQAADFFAYETYKRMNEVVTGGRRRRKSIESIVEGLPLHDLFLGSIVTA